MRSINRCLSAVFFVLGTAVAGAQGISAVPASPSAYVPFNLNVTFATDKCFDATFPLLGENNFKSGQISVVLTHLRVGSCKRTWVVQVPGLPEGSHRVVVSTTYSGRRDLAGTNAERNTTLIDETVAAEVAISPLPGAAGTRRFWHARFDSGEKLCFANCPYTGVGPVMLTINDYGRVYSYGDYLEVGDRTGATNAESYAFSAYGSDASMPPPPELSWLYLVDYPDFAKDRYVPRLDGSAGTFATSSYAEARRLTMDWHGRDLPQQNSSNILVGKLVDGACPLGMSPVYQAFHLSGLAHRYTQNPSTYRMLLANGYKGDGAVFCSPSK